MAVSRASSSAPSKKGQAGGLVAAYVQDRFSPVRNLTLDLGVRFDRYDLLDTHNAGSPRAGIAYHIPKSHTVLRFAYSRLFSPPPIEYQLLSGHGGGRWRGTVAAARDRRLLSGIRSLAPGRPALERAVDIAERLERPLPDRQGERGDADPVRAGADGGGATAVPFLTPDDCIQAKVPAPPHHPIAPDVYGLRSIALMEWLKAIGAIAAGILLAMHPHASFGHIAERILHALHIARNSDVAIAVIGWARRIEIHQIHVFTGLIFLYAVIRTAEGWGLWRARAWAEWLGFLNGLAYLPIEVMELFKHFNWLKVAVLVINVIVVLYLGWEIRKGRREKRARAERRGYPSRSPARPSLAASSVSGWAVSGRDLPYRIG